MEKEQIAKRIEQSGIIAIIRTKSPEQLCDVCRALLDGGIDTIELTMTIPGAVEQFRQVSRVFGDKALLGMGSVLDARMAKEALNAGAQFIVSPITRAEIADTVNAAGKVCMLGAYTPTEAETAQRVGLDFVKIFPADNLGVQYIKALLAPMPHLRLVPTGGVNLENIVEFLRAGVSAVGVGSSLVTKNILANSDWKGLTTLAAQFANAVKMARNKS
ncbi:MAG: bifunctional 4-hydroxy-2-oxoglutarate aldolase/2-dehydro-3-deoxy-phosphogluconate aldolase [Verrucomicrobiia bacterium]